MSRVARYHADRTNQKLYFARLSCQQAEQLEHVQQIQALRESAVFHLQGAVLAFLQELVRYYRLNEMRPTIQNVEQHIKQTKLFSGEFIRASARDFSLFSLNLFSFSFTSFVALCRLANSRKLPTQN